ncbi:MAG TPA: SH3 domain-containing protein [Gallionellaceae bacterium]
MKWMAAICLSLACSLAYAGDPAYAVRDTDLKAKPYSDADTLQVVPANSKVEILQRKSSWMQIKVGGKTGWVRMLSLRLGEVAQKRGDSGLAALFNVANTGSSGSTVTTGVRGLSEEQLKNTKPNPQELELGRSYVVDKAEARKFGQAGKLKTRSMDYLPAPEGE